MNIEKLKQIVVESHSYADCIRALEWNDNGIERRKLKSILDEYNICRDHFDSQYNKKLRLKYEEITKLCPVCDKPFVTKKDHPREQTTCSKSCSNTYFNGISRNINITNHRTICFRHHDKKCVICGEEKIVEAHHLDHDSTHNVPENLIPLCPTHHQYWHSRYRKKVEPTIRKYIKEWKENKKVG